MLELNVIDLLSTLCVGAYILLSLIFLNYSYYLIFGGGKQRARVFINLIYSNAKNELKQTGITVILLILLHTIGVMGLDFTDNFTDSNSEKNTLVSVINYFEPLKSEKSIRLEPLVKNNNELTGLGKKVFEKFPDLERKKYFIDSTQVKETWRNLNPKINEKTIEDNNDFVSFINKIFYTCKNWCYLESEPAKKELSDIQVRIDLSRALGIITFLTILTYFGMLILNGSIQFIKSKTPFKQQFISARKAVNSSNFKLSLRYHLKVLFILSMIYKLSSFCYNVAQNNFNERAYGYFMYHVENKVEKK